MQRLQGGAGAVYRDGAAGQPQRPHQLRPHHPPRHEARAGQRPRVPHPRHRGRRSDGGRGRHRDGHRAGQQPPLSIVLVGVGDGPWDIMEDFDDNLPARKFDNFQFVNFHSALKDAKNPEASVALASLMEVPSQYQTMLEMGYFSKCSAMENKL